MSQRLLLCLCFSSAFIVALPAIADVWYVDKDNLSDVEDGTSWQTAFKTIQPAIDAASVSGAGEVWVAKGFYDEERTGMIQDIPAGCLKLSDEIQLFGGFNGDETSVEERDILPESTVIDGSKSFQGSPAYSVVNAGNNSILDGFTITGGFANKPGSGSLGKSGGGLSTQAYAQVEIRNCLFTNNQASSAGGAIGQRGGTITVRNTKFTQNEAPWGGVKDAPGIASFYDCIFEYNKALSSDGHGGVARCGDSCYFVRCIFRNNSAAYGGALDMFGGGGISNCLFIDNAADEQGGALWLHSSRDAQTEIWINTYNVSHCTFINNQAPEGPTIYLYGEINAETNLMPDAGDEPVKVEQGVYRQWGVLFSGDPHFVDAEHGDYRLMPDSPAIDGNELLYSTVPELFTPDLAGTARPINEKYDFGAYEYDPEADSDGDGLTNNTEWTTYHTHLYKADTDGDHVPDGIEIQYGTDPLDPSSTPPILPLAAGAALTGLLLVALWRARRMRK